MTREEALGVVRNWGYLTSEKKEALETLIPELKKDDRERIKESCIHFLELQKSHHASTIEIDECINWLNDLVPPKWLYRLEYRDGTCGLWYNGEGKWCFVEGIGSVEGCKTKDLPMDHDERYKQDGRDWFSSCSNKEDLLHWYSLRDAEELLKKGFVFTRYLATEYHEYENETVFIKDSSLVREEIDIFELFGKTKPMFKVGQTIIYKGTENIAPTKMTISDIAKGQYWDDNCCIVPISDQDNWELVEKKPTEWSEEDEIHQLHAISLIEDIKDWANKDGMHSLCIARCIESIDWLNSLKDRVQPQSHWKPSDEQIRILELAIDYWKPNDVSATTPLYNLLEQLKKLKEE